ncbi:uncharacterized protein N7496_012652 [Penicillium cataractarum]|uniref:Uncharacterized protein n=1 Tax=Penicillium cataractarum TaxID=2100454 RepID=A0A9W9R9G1_9EURO|nr:uncharacterized protein N7496_012652 [Penicillium cataractarum]KAJ5355440.1 hypothetical protein N7496_012652 [Penicillium cataractarum]
MPSIDARDVSETATATSASASASSVSPARPRIADLSGLLKALDDKSIGDVWSIVYLLAFVWVLSTFLNCLFKFFESRHALQAKEMDKEARIEVAKAENDARIVIATCEGDTRIQEAKWKAMAAASQSVQRTMNLRYLQSRDTDLKTLWERDNAGRALGVESARSEVSGVEFILAPSGWRMPPPPAPADDSE